MTQMVDNLLNKCKALSSNPSIGEKKKKKEIRVVQLLIV
jgi:hypothetical protein